MATAIDPVCNMEINTDTAAASSEYQGRTYYFCSAGCKQAFDSDPQRYADAGSQATRGGAQTAETS